MYLFRLYGVPGDASGSLITYGRTTALNILSRTEGSRHRYVGTSPCVQQPLSTRASVLTTTEVQSIRMLQTVNGVWRIGGAETLLGVRPT